MFIKKRKYSCACTESELIILNLFTPFEMRQIRKKLESTKFATIVRDTSNNKNLRVVAILIRYFSPKTLMRIKIFEITNL